MRILRFVDRSGRVCWGQEIDPAPAGRARRIRGNPFGRFRVTDDVVEVGKRLAPVNPPNIFAIGRNYAEHAREVGSEVPEAPLVFLKATSSVTGPGCPIVLPASAPNEVDFEAELAVVIGRTTRNVRPEVALDCVLGYTAANDVTARDCQKRIDKQWARAKSFDTFCPLGPVLVTADDFDPECATIRSLLNGTLMQEASTSTMIHGCRELVSFLSHQFTLLPGTVILTGTPAGVGIGRQPPVFLKDGDEICVEVGGVGRLCNPVVREG